MLRKVLATLQNPSPWFTRTPFSFLSHQMPSLPWSHLGPSPTVWGLSQKQPPRCPAGTCPLNTSLSPWHSGWPESAHLHSQTPPQLGPGIQTSHTPAEPVVSQRPSAGFWAVVPSVLSAHPDATSPDSSDPHTRSSYSWGLTWPSPCS